MSSSVPHSRHTPPPAPEGQGGGTVVVFVHGFLDSGRVWDAVGAGLRTPEVKSLALDLPGCGDRADHPGPFTLYHLAADVISLLEGIAAPVLLVGQSMGAPVAELAAAACPEQVSGLALLTPIPMAGMHLPPEVIEQFRAPGDDPEVHRAMRRQLASALDETALDTLVESSLRVRPEVVRALADSWNNGLLEAPGTSDYHGPVLILTGADDPFVNAELVGAAVQVRFPGARTAVIDGAGHWPHLERPEAVAAHLDAFLATSLTARR
ncbi:alpha/beta fold hydrolase [Streptomyces mirabilis]|uniref:alpha/beta fold hydrolase n=1 Tax=Streptomyces mirabilis TaxID=68239 RepID=UPI003331C72F